MYRIFLLAAILISILACGVISIANGPTLFPPMTPGPRILSPTASFLPTLTPGIVSLTPALTLTDLPSSTLVVTPSPTPLSTTTSPGLLDLSFRGCETSLDISHQMGEVTNAYVRLRNGSTEALTNVCTTLSASDEARPHPDKTVCLTSLPAGSQTTVKLTIDTGFQEDTSLKVETTSADGRYASVSAVSCSAIGLPVGLSSEIGVIVPIP